MQVYYKNSTYSEAAVTWLQMPWYPDLEFTREINIRCGKLFKTTLNNKYNI
jgi:hypothetical protein